MEGPRRRSIVVLAQYILRFLVVAGLLQFIELSTKGRITQFIERIEPMIRRKISRMKWFPPVLVAIDPVKAPNQALFDYFARRVHFVNSYNEGMISRLLELSTEYPEAPVRPLRKVKRVGSPWEMSPSQRINKSWEAETRDLLERMGIEIETPVVLLAVRDPAYYEALQTDIGENAGTETLPDTYVRNPDITTYLEAIMRLTNLGCTVIHFGSQTSRLPDPLKGVIVDYSGEHRTPKGDLLLARHCTMMMSGAAGTWALASLFNRPVALSNLYVPFIGGVSKRDRQIPQLLRNREDGNYLSFLEMVKTGGRYSYQSNCEADGIDLVKNSAEEIADLALEMHQRLSGTFAELPGDSELHENFLKIQNLSLPPSYMHCPISTSFLRRHAALL